MHLQVICLGIMKYLLVVLDRALDALDPPKVGEGGGLVHLPPWVRGLGALALTTRSSLWELRPGGILVCWTRGGFREMGPVDPLVHSIRGEFR
jgi:hypothetical protein